MKKVVCKFGGAAESAMSWQPPGKRAVSLKNGTLEFTVEFNASNDVDFIKEYLMKSL